MKGKKVMKWKDFKKFVKELREFTVLMNQRLNTNSEFSEEMCVYSTFQLDFTEKGDYSGNQRHVYDLNPFRINLITGGYEGTEINKKTGKEQGIINIKDYFERYVR